MSGNEQPRHLAIPPVNPGLAPRSSEKPAKLHKSKPYREVNDTLVINDETDPDRVIRNIYISCDVLSLRALSYRRKIELMEAEIEAAKARIALEKAQHMQLQAEINLQSREMWMRIGDMPEFDDRLKWRFDRKKTPEDCEFLVLVRTIDEDDERELAMKAFSKMLAEHMGTEDAVKRALRSEKSAAAGHYL